MSDLDDLSRGIVDAYTTAKPIKPVREQVTTIDDAYAIQRKTIALWKAQGRQLRGHKIGLTSQAVQQQLGVDQPDFGVLFADMIFTNGARLALDAVMQPRVEAEIAFVLKRDLRGTNISPQDVIDATEFVSPALEICGSRIEGWNIKIFDTIADNASSGVVVLGEERHVPKLDQLPGLLVSLKRDGEVVSEGSGAACLGNPANAVAWLAETLTVRGDGLHAGDVIMSGAMSKMIPAVSGETFVGEFGAFGRAAVEFAQ